MFKSSGINLVSLNFKPDPQIQTMILYLNSFLNKPFCEHLPLSFYKIALHQVKPFTTKILVKFSLWLKNQSYRVGTESQVVPGSSLTRERFTRMGCTQACLAVLPGSPCIQTNTNTGRCEKHISLMVGISPIINSDGILLLPWQDQRCTCR